MFGEDTDQGKKYISYNKFFPSRVSIYRLCKAGHGLTTLPASIFQNELYFFLSRVSANSYVVAGSHVLLLNR